MRLTFLLRIFPRFARLISSRTNGGMLSALTSRVGNLALHQNVSYRVALEETGRTVLFGDVRSFGWMPLIPFNA